MSSPSSACGHVYIEIKPSYMTCVGRVRIVKGILLTSFYRGTIQAIDLILGSRLYSKKTISQKKSESLFQRLPPIRTLIHDTRDLSQSNTSEELSSTATSI